MSTTHAWTIRQGQETKEAKEYMDEFKEDGQEIHVIMTKKSKNKQTKTFATESDARAYVDECGRQKRVVLMWASRNTSVFSHRMNQWMERLREAKEANETNEILREAPPDWITWRNAVGDNMLHLVIRRGINHHGCDLWQPLANEVNHQGFSPFQLAVSIHAFAVATRLVPWMTMQTCETAMKWCGEYAMVHVEVWTALWHRMIDEYAHTTSHNVNRYDGWMTLWNRTHNESTASVQLVGAQCTKDRKEMCDEIVRLWQLPRHPSIPYIDAFYMDAYETGFTMQFPHTTSVSAHIRDAPLKRSEIHSLLGQLARIMAVLHQAKVVHGRLNPDYLLLAGSCVQLVDPGLMCIMSQMHGTTVNNPLAYFAPEQLNQVASVGSLAMSTWGTVTTAVDVYAFGALMVQFYTDQFPWQGCDDLVGELLIKRRLLPQLAFIDEEDVKVFAERCMNMDPTKRPTAHDCVKWTQRFYRPTETKQVAAAQRSPLRCMTRDEWERHKDLMHGMGYRLKWFRCEREFLLKDEEMFRPQIRDMRHPEWLCRLTEMEMALLHLCGKKQADKDAQQTMERGNTIVEVDDPNLLSRMTKDYLCSRAHEYSVALQSYLRSGIVEGSPPLVRPRTLFLTRSTCNNNNNTPPWTYPVIEETKRIGTEVSLHVVGFLGPSLDDRVTSVGRDLIPIASVTPVWPIVPMDERILCPPPSLCCSLTQQFLHEPVVAADGYAYNKTQWEQYVTSSTVSPVTGQVLSHTHTRPSPELNRMRDDYIHNRSLFKCYVDPYDVVIMSGAVALQHLRNGMFQLEEFATIFVDYCETVRTIVPSESSAPSSPVCDIFTEFYDTCPHPPRIIGLTNGCVDARGFAAAAYTHQLSTWLNIHRDIECNMRSRFYIVHDKTTNRVYSPAKSRQVNRVVLAEWEPLLCEATTPLTQVVEYIGQAYGPWCRRAALSFLSGLWERPTATTVTTSEWNESFHKAMREVAPDVSDGIVDPVEYMTSRVFAPSLSDAGTLLMPLVNTLNRCLTERSMHLTGRSSPPTALVYVEHHLTAHVVGLFLLSCSRYTTLLPSHTKVGILVGPSDTQPVGMTVQEQIRVTEQLGKTIQILVASNNSILSDGVPYRDRVTVQTDFVLAVQGEDRSWRHYIDFCIHPAPVLMEFVPASNDATSFTLMGEEEEEEEEEKEKCIYPEILPEQADETIDVPFAGKCSLNNSVSLLNRYCAKHLKERAVFRYLDVQDDGFQVEVRLPWIQGAPFLGKMCSRKRMAKASAAFMVCRLLHERGELTDLLLPPSALRRRRARIKKIPDATIGPTDELTTEETKTREEFSRLLPRPLPHAVMDCQKVPFVLQKGWRVPLEMPLSFTSTTSVPFHVYHMRKQHDTLSWTFLFLVRVQLPCDEFPDIDDTRLMYKGVTRLTDQQVYMAQEIHNALFRLVLRTTTTTFRDVGKMYLVVPYSSALVDAMPTLDPVSFVCPTCHLHLASAKELDRHVEQHATRKRLQTPPPPPPPATTTATTPAAPLNGIVLSPVENENDGKTHIMDRIMIQLRHRLGVNNICYMGEHEAHEAHMKRTGQIIPILYLKDEYLMLLVQGPSVPLMNVNTLTMTLESHYEVQRDPSNRKLRVLIQTLQEFTFRV